MRPAVRIAVPALALAATLALAGCGGRSAGGTASTSAPAGPASTAPTSSADPVGPVVDQDTLDHITAVLDDTSTVLDAVDQEIATDPQE